VIQVRDGDAINCSSGIFPAEFQGVEGYGDRVWTFRVNPAHGAPGTEYALRENDRRPLAASGLFRGFTETEEEARTWAEAIAGRRLRSGEEIDLDACRGRSVMVVLEATEDLLGCAVIAVLPA
jgi:hypothetical protein